MERRPWLLIALLALCACGPYPRDPEDTLEDVRGGILRVGAVEGPQVMQRSDGGAVGPEAELVEGFARSIDARVEWTWLAPEEALERLERFELHLVAAGLKKGSPWGGRIGMSRPWRGSGDTARVLAVPPGENGFLVALDRFIEARR